MQGQRDGMAVVAGPPDDIAVGDIVGTADEVDIDAGAARVKPAPPPSSDAISSPSISVDVSTASSSSSSPLPQLRAGRAHDDDNVGDAQESRRVMEAAQQDGHHDSDGDRTDDAYEPDNDAGAQSPAARATLELPPELDLDAPPSGTSPPGRHRYDGGAEASRDSYGSPQSHRQAVYDAEHQPEPSSLAAASPSPYPAAQMSHPFDLGIHDPSSQQGRHNEEGLAASEIATAALPPLLLDGVMEDIPLDGSTPLSDETASHAPSHRYTLQGTSRTSSDAQGDDDISLCSPEEDNASSPSPRPYPPSPAAPLQRRLAVYPDEESQAAGPGYPAETGLTSISPSPPFNDGHNLSSSLSQQASAPMQQQQQTQQQAGQAPQQPPPPAKQPVFAYHHDDSDTTMAELEEFFSYVEVRSVVEEGREAWARGWEGVAEFPDEARPSESPDWPTAPAALTKAHIDHLIEELEHRDPEIRFEAARRIAYIAHGTPIYSTSPQHHLHLVISNCTLLRNAGALTAVHEALKAAGARWNVVR